MADKTTVDKLKSCPFCGADGTIMEAQGKGPPYIASCRRCPASMSLEWIKDEAVNAWNKRTPAPPSDDLRAAMEALRREIEHPDQIAGVLAIRSKAVLAAWDAQQGERS